jgi:hypothetical protein
MEHGAAFGGGQSRLPQARFPARKLVAGITASLAKVPGEYNCPYNEVVHGALSEARPIIIMFRIRNNAAEPWLIVKLFAKRRHISYNVYNGNTFGNNWGAVHEGCVPLK